MNKFLYAGFGLSMLGLGLTILSIKSKHMETLEKIKKVEKGEISICTKDYIITHPKFTHYILYDIECDKCNDLYLILDRNLNLVKNGKFEPCKELIAQEDLEKMLGN